jgi:2-keto-myo-inositol isomerase
MSHDPTRRNLLHAAALLATPLPAPAAPVYCLNTATLRGYKLPVTDLIDSAGRAGFTAIEPWMDQLNGVAPAELRKRLNGAGLAVESAIAFPQWILNNAALDETKRDMDLLAQIGGKRIAAPPSGANNGPSIPLERIAERYRAVLEIGDRTGIVAELEFWGGSQNLRTLPEAVHVAMLADHPRACVLADVFHLYKGGSPVRSLGMLSAQTLQVVHLNDYPAAPPRETIADRDRVFPGDGVAPLRQILGELLRINPAVVLSLELFNPSYWTGDPQETARRGLGKMQQAVRSAV